MVGDPVGDSAAGTDISRGFAAKEGENLYLRVDVANIAKANTAPSFTPGGDQAVLEDDGPQTLSWASAIDDGDGGTQILTFNVTGNTNVALFIVGPAISATGALSFTPAANAFGTATITVTLSDDGGTANGGVDTSQPETFTITVTGINDQPSFTASNPPAVSEDAGAQTRPGWATFNPGNLQESAQTLLQYSVSNVTNAGLFSVQPTVNTSGNLSYTPAAGASGVSNFDVQVQDNGGTANGGDDTSAVQTFTITVNAVDDPPTAVNDAATVTEDSGANAIDVLANDTDPDGGPKSITSVTQPANGAVVITGGGTGLTYAPNANYCNNPPGTTLDTFSYTLTPGGSTATVSVTVTCVDDSPVAVADSAPVTEDSGPNPIAVLANDTDPDGGPISITSVTQPANGTVVITGGGTGLTYQTNPNYCNAPPGTTLDTFTYTLAPGGSTATVTVTVNCLNDAPVLDLPGPGVNYDTITPIILDATATVTDVDSPNFDTGVLTANVTTACDVNDRLGVRNEGIGPNQIGVSGADVTYNPGTGAVTIGTIATEFDCTTPAVQTLAITLNADADLTATQALLRNLLFFNASATPPATQRTVEVVLTDGDSGTSNTATKSVDLDAAPTVNTIGPANNATGVAIGADVVITFSEAVTVTGNWFQIACPTSGNRSALSGTAVTGGPAVFTINPTVDFANGETCTVTVTALQVADQDTLDPPDNMATDFNSTFTTVDIAPTATAGTAPGTIANNATITLNFSEAVNIAAGGITWACAPGFTPALPQNSVTTITLTPTGALPNGTACNVTLESTLITDVDAVDPPNQLDGNNSSDIIDGDADDQVFVYTVDAAPAFTGSTPINGAIDFLPGANLVVNFSEAVNVSTASFTINCGAGNYEVTGTGTTAITLDPTADLPGGTGCTVTGVPAQINDSDSIDPPANPAAFSFSFTTASVANDDSYNVTPHLTLSSAAGATEVDVNDQLGTGTITGFGFGACTGTAPGAQLDAGVANGRFTLNADGSFSYEPPAGVANVSRTFCYTVTGGDTANITFTLQDTELVWFVDASAASGGIGTQARPFQTLAAAVGVDTDNDTIFVKHNAGGYTCGIGLLPNEKLIGEGSGSTLAALSGVTPVAGSSFPTLTNTSAQWPNLTAATNCVTLATGNTIRGFNFGNVVAANTALSGTSFGTLTVNDTAINTNGRALNLTSGTLTATFTGITSTGGTNNVNLTQV